MIDQNIHEPNAVERHKLSIAKHQNAARLRHKSKAAAWADGICQRGGFCCGERPAPGEPFQ
jgi:hypothetical protein